MKRRKSITRAVLLTATLLFAVTFMQMQVFAASPYCSFAKCNKTKTHVHNVCSKTSCTKSTKHSHKGKQYYGHSKNDGHAYHKCGATNCVKKSAHTHKHKTSANSKKKHSGGHHSGHRK